MQDMNELKPIYAKVSIWKDGETEIPQTSIWDYELLKLNFHTNLELKIGGKLKIKDSDGGGELTITDIQFEVLESEDDNKYGLDIAQQGQSGINNVIVKIFVTGF